MIDECVSATVGPTYEVLQSDDNIMQFIETLVDNDDNLNGVFNSLDESQWVYNTVAYVAPAHIDAPGAIVSVYQVYKIIFIARSKDGNYGYLKILTTMNNPYNIKNFF